MFAFFPQQAQQDQDPPTQHFFHPQEQQRQHDHFVAAGVPPMQNRFQTDGGSHETSSPSCLHLTELELEWAHEIKDAIRQDEEIKHVCDYEIAQMAIVTLGQEDLTSVLERIFHLQCLKEEYQLTDDPEEAVELMRSLSSHNNRVIFSPSI